MRETRSDAASAPAVPERAADGFSSTSSVGSMPRDASDLSASLRSLARNVPERDSRSFQRKSAMGVRAAKRRFRQGRDACLGGAQCFFR